jgi:hypothetical protein
MIFGFVRAKSALHKHLISVELICVHTKIKLLANTKSYNYLVLVDCEDDIQEGSYFNQIPSGVVEVMAKPQEPLFGTSTIGECNANNLFRCPRTCQDLSHLDRNLL